MAVTLIEMQCFLCDLNICFGCYVECLTVYSKKLEVKEEDEVIEISVVGGKKTRHGEFPHMVSLY